MRWWPAPAKLNLFLHVTGRQPDGYHELQTIFQLIDRCDRIGVAVRRDGRILRGSGPEGVAPEADLAVRAARALQQQTGTHLGADLEVVKQIPTGGGLGGGSSDAATVLVALNNMWRTGLSLPELATLGVGLGADVPVFVLGRSAWGEGRGERLTPVALPERWYVVIHPRVHVSTAEIFQAPELTRNSSVITIRAFSAGETVNVCEPVVRARYAQVAQALDWLSHESAAAGAVGDARMTGTGACLFAAFAQAHEAQRIAARVPDRWMSFVARGLARSPLHEELDS